jgi:hypothetical protein
MQTRSFSSVWYATPERVASPTKFVVFDDKGTLQLSPDTGITFQGRKGAICIPAAELKKVELVRQTVNWFVYVVIDAAMIYVLYQQGWGLTAIVALVAVSNVFGLLIGMNTRWVKVEWETEDEVHAAYFAHAGAMGWSGVGGGTGKMYEAMK